MNPEHLEQAACRDHPFLDPDAWFEFKDGAPSGAGVKALIVCRFACPVRAECQALTFPWEAIAGGGWWTRRGEFINPGDGQWVDIHQAVTLLRTSYSRFQRQVKAGKITAVKSDGRKHFYDVDDVLELAPVLGPAHGTSPAIESHILRGQPLCSTCTGKEKRVPIKQAA